MQNCQFYNEKHFILEWGDTWWLKTTVTRYKDCYHVHPPHLGKIQLLFKLNTVELPLGNQCLEWPSCNFHHQFLLRTNFVHKKTRQPSGCMSIWRFPPELHPPTPPYSLPTQFHKWSINFGHPDSMRANWSNLWIDNKFSLVPTSSYQTMLFFPEGWLPKTDSPLY